MKDDEKTLTLTNFPRNHDVLGVFLQLKYLQLLNDAEFQKELIGSITNNDNFQKYLLASSEIGQHLQEKIDLQVTHGKLNDARVRHQLDSLYKNVLRRQNLTGLCLRTFRNFTVKIQ